MNNQQLQAPWQRGGWVKRPYEVNEGSLVPVQGGEPELYEPLKCRRGLLEA